MSNNNDWLDALLEQVAAGKLLPQEALEQFFLRKRAEGAAALTDEDNAFISAMDAVQVAHLIAKWCEKCAAMAGGLQSICLDLRRPSFFTPFIIPSYARIGTFRIKARQAPIINGDNRPLINAKTAPTRSLSCKTQYKTIQVITPIKTFLNVFLSICKPKTSFEEVDT